MKQNKLKLIVAIIAICAFSGLLKANEPQDVNKTFKVNKGGILKVSLMSGSVKIASWDKMEVAVNVEGADEKEANQIKMNQSGNTITIDDQGDWGWSNDKDISIKVPVEFNVVVNTNSGDISVKGDLAGYFKAYSGGGDINTANISGATDISTNGGDVTIGNIRSNLNLSTKGGDVHVDNVSGKAEISTMGGSVKVGDVSKNLNISTFGGDINTGNIGGDASLRTMGGSIDVNKVSGNAALNTNGGNLNLEGATGSVTAKTLGGNINLKNINGSVNAKTNSGNIIVELIPSGKDDSRISTLNGGITLYIPSTAKATIEAKIRAYGWWTSGDENKYIISDFKAKSMEAGNHASGVKATYVLNGGGANIVLSSVNDKIRIKKLEK